MATVPIPASVAPGNFVTAALWDANVYAGLNFLLAPVRFKGYSSTAQSIAVGTTPIPLLLDTELYDSDGGHSTTTNTSRFVCQTPGLYHVGGSGTFASNSTATRAISVVVNGIVITGSMIQSMPSATNGTSVITATDVQLVLGDYVEIGVWQNTAAALAMTASANLGLSSTMYLHRISN